MYSPVEAALRSKAAGVDVLLPMGTRDDQIAIAVALAEAAESGAIPRSAFESTADRLQRARRRFRITHALPPFAEPAAELTERARAVAARSIAVVRGREQLPLAAETKLLLVDCVVPRFSLAEEALERASLMRRLVGAAFPQLDAVALEADAADAAQPEIVRRAAAADAVLLLTRNATHQPWQVELGRALAQSGRPLLHAAVRVPYDVALVPAAAVTLATFGDADVSLGALVDVLSGTALPQGRLPVSLPEEVA
jgi:beta-N-acetylhexosaminidase